jgi:hypothetical protein
MRFLAAVCAVALVGFSLPAGARADIGPRWWGDHAAEPLGLKDVDITHQDLTIDLRPLAAVQPVHVEAVYRLHNPGAARKLDLVFVSGAAGVTDFEVRLDDRLLESRPVPREQLLGKGHELPKSWQPPKQGLGIDHPEWYLWTAVPMEVELLEFSVELPPGLSTLSARYRARAWGTDESYPTVTWQFPYVLAPAREWKDFGGLDVTVYLPDGWQSASEPALDREGAVLRGSFREMPADALMLATRAPVGPELRRAVYLYVGLYALLVVAGGVLCWWVGRLLGQLLADRWDQWAFRSLTVAGPALLALLWVVLIILGAQFAWRGIVASLAGQESPYFRGPDFHFPLACLVFLLALAALPSGFLIAWWSVRTRLR